MSFDSIPILDLSAARDAAKKPGFLNELRHALLEVGFLYIKNTGIDGKLIEDVIVEGKKFFDLPVEKKLEIEMKNAPSFLGMPFASHSANRAPIITKHPLIHPEMYLADRGF